MKSALFAAASGLVLSVAAAAAAPAVVESPLNLRAGPGPQYPVVGGLPGGDRGRGRLHGQLMPSAV